MDPRFFPLLLCPDCRSSVTGVSLGVRCSDCGRTYPLRDGYYDLLHETLHPPIATTMEQRFMESELVARTYERFWRPAFVRVLAGGGARSLAGGFPGEMFIHKNSLAMEDRQGPWLDLSCGPGLFSRAMAAADPGSMIVGIDISKAMLEVAVLRSKGYGNVAFVRADAHELPFADGVFGGVNNSGALHTYHFPEQVFQEVLRVLRPGGIYVASTFSKQTSWIARAVSHLAGIRRSDPTELRAQLSRVGFADYDDVHSGDAVIFRVRRP